MDGLTSASEHLKMSLWQLGATDDVTLSAKHLSTEQDFVVILAGSYALAASVIQQVLAHNFIHGFSLIEITPELTVLSAHSMTG